MRPRAASLRPEQPAVISPRENMRVPQSAPVSLDDRIVGCVLGGALGDAWGLTEGGHGAMRREFPRNPELSDDTQLTLATCESIVEFGGVDAESIAAHLLRWFLARKVHSIGSSTLKAMRDLAAGVHWALAGARGEYSAGNGAAMRIAPLAFVLDPCDAQNRTKIRDVCRITHHNDEAYAGSLAVAVAIRSVLTGEWSDQNSFLTVAAESLPDSSVRDRMLALRELRSPVSEIASTFGATGYVVDTVPLALYCAQNIAAAPLEEVIREAANIQGDSDTIASITGQIAGAVVGSLGVPQALVAGIQGSEETTLIARRFAEYIRNNYGGFDGARFAD